MTFSGAAECLPCVRKNDTESLCLQLASIEKNHREKKVFLISLVLVQHWACVRSRSPAPQTRPPPSLYPFGASRSARSSLLPRRGFHYRDGCESVQIGPPVVPEQRSGGRQPPRTCCLFTATPSAHKTGKSQDVSAAQGDKRGKRCRTGRAGWTGEKQQRRRRLAAWAG